VEVQFLSVDEISRIQLALDHEKMIGDALNILKDKKISINHDLRNREII
jgi:hypothetical protein